MNFILRILGCTANVVSQKFSLVLRIHFIFSKEQYCKLSYYSSLQKYPFVHGVHSGGGNQHPLLPSSLGGT